MISKLLNYDGRLKLSYVSTNLVARAMEKDKENGVGLASEYLSNSEREKFRSLNHPKRRIEWLSGRIAAKGAVKSLLEPDPPPFPDISIESAEDNSPRAVIRTCGVATAAPHVSISHSGPVAVALASTSPGLGIDVETITDKIVNLMDKFSNDREAELVMERTGMAKAEALTSIWAVKEAARKALGPDMATMKGYEVRDVRRGGGEWGEGREWGEGEYALLELSFEKPNKRGGELKAVVLLDGKNAYAVTRALDPAKAA